MKLFQGGLIAMPLHMPSSDSASWDPFFKDSYHGDAIINTLQDENPIQACMTSEIKDESWEGRQKIVPKRIGRNWSGGAIPMGGDLPQSGRSVGVDSKILMKLVVGRCGFGEDVMQASRNDKGSWKRVAAAEMDWMVGDLSFIRNRIGWGDGRGVLARISGSHSAVTTIEVKDPMGVPGLVLGNRFIHGDANGGMTVAILDGGTFAVKNVVTVTAINADGTDFTSDLAVTAADNDLVVNAQSLTQTSYTNEPDGILAAIDDGTFVTNYHNVPRASVPLEKAFVVAGVGPLSLDAMQQPFDATQIRVGGSGVDLLWMEHSVRRAYLGLLEADRRYTGADLMAPDGGTKAVKAKQGAKRAITFGDVPVVAERDCPFGTIFGMKRDTFVRYFEDKPSWNDRGGAVLKWIPGTTRYTAFFEIFENYHCYEPARNFRMEGITVQQLVAHSF